VWSTGSEFSSYQWEFSSDILYSTREYKKVRLEFYKPEFYEWEEAQNLTPQTAAQV